MGIQHIFTDGDMDLVGRCDPAVRETLLHPVGRDVGDFSLYRRRGDPIEGPQEHFGLLTDINFGDHVLTERTLNDEIGVVRYNIQNGLSRPYDSPVFRMNRHIEHHPIHRCSDGEAGVGIHLWGKLHPDLENLILHLAQLGGGVLTVFILNRENGELDLFDAFVGSGNELFKPRPFPGLGCQLSFQGQHLGFIKIAPPS